jgi:hypothetical protein
LLNAAAGPLHDEHAYADEEDSSSRKNAKLCGTTWSKHETNPLPTSKGAIPGGRFIPEQSRSAGRLLSSVYNPECGKRKKNFD